MGYIKCLIKVNQEKKNLSEKVWLNAVLHNIIWETEKNGQWITNQSKPLVQGLMRWRWSTSSVR